MSPFILSLETYKPCSRVQIRRCQACSVPNNSLVQVQIPREISGPGPLHDGGSTEYSLVDSESILSPLINVASSGVLKIVDPAVDCVQKLIAHGYLRGEADPSGEAGGKLLSKLIESVCKCHDLGDDQMELAVLKTLLSAVTSISLRIHGDCLLQIGVIKNVVNQTTAKASLIQIVFRRMEADSSTVPIQPIVVADLMEPIEKLDVDGSMTMFVH
ncbi:hypothetical protein F8388_010644 [Cannabis sativa]|uniref:Mon2/Sec7/BIG1-like dimerisation and cyclophilin-binding domain-containing protein n=1 Tax=Cannabis sativa TaxID=3483 RepID=A0A7J6G5C9_CANSA|nr:hypothetical protein G4B88_003632 [Cannabis sativa]KAF4378205.1 hypothetical protein F8388_010644 [Cannabis sativa]